MSNRPFKRARMTYQVSPKRPIDKSLIVVNHILNTTQQSTVLTTATFPCTITGLRWQFNATSGAASGNSIEWAIVLVKDGNNANTLSLTDGATLYEPEQNVLAWGVTQVMDSDAGTGNANYQWEGDTKSMRKLMGGDQLVFISKAGLAHGTGVGCVQFFCKS